ncbi:MAG: glycosyltransferase [Desulfobulbaceae bacterium]|nr:glycosyltransferase [Candidatus Kapabacteria bacterium]MBS4000984.1 glycosyltransferase [Desulfobulbaceae bacterium]
MEAENPTDIYSTLKRNVLVIAYYFPPMGLSGVQRTLKFVKYLPKFGWHPIVLTTGDLDYYAFDETLIDELGEENITIVRTPSKGKPTKTRNFPNQFIHKLGRMYNDTFFVPDSKIGWKKQAVNTANAIIAEHEIHAIFATAPPFTDFLIADEISRKHDIPFLADYRDTWVDNPFKYYPTPMHKNKNLKLEHKILSHAQKSFVTTRFAKEVLLRRYRFLSHEDIFILPHGYDPEDFANANHERHDKSKFVITHSGLFQDDRTPKYFLKALSIFLSKNKQAKEATILRFVGLMRPSHLKMATKYKLSDNIELTGYVTHKESIRHILDSDVLWLMMNDTYRSPGKLYEYFGARKPIFINAPTGAMTKIVQDSGAGFVTEPDNVKDIVKKLAELFELWQSGNLPKPNEKFVVAFDRSKITNDLARELSLSVKY